MNVWVGPGYGVKRAAAAFKHFVCVCICVIPHRVTVTLQEAPFCFLIGFLSHTKTIMTRHEESEEQTWEQKVYDLLDSIDCQRGVCPSSRESDVLGDNHFCAVS